MKNLRSTSALAPIAKFDCLPDCALVRKPTVRAMTGLSDVTIWRREREGKFPKRVRIGANSVAWRVGDLRRWLLALEQAA